MGSVVGRVSTIVKGKVHAALEAMEDVNATLDLSLAQQTEMLQKVRRGIVDVVAAKSRLQVQFDALQERSARLDAQARQALAASREDLARLALARKHDLAPQIQSMHSQLETLQIQQQQLMDGESKVTARIQAVRARKTALQAQYDAARAQVRLAEATSGISAKMADVDAAMRRIEDRTEAMWARSKALGELTAAGMLADGSGGDPLQAQLDQITAGSRVEAELAAMRAQLAGGSESLKQLGA
jgi:phage shock protein A